MPFCIVCGFYSLNHMRDGVCSEECWLSMFKGAKYNYKTGVKVNYDKEVIE